MTHQLHIVLLLELQPVLFCDHMMMVAAILLICLSFTQLVYVIYTYISISISVYQYTEIQAKFTLVER